LRASSKDFEDILLCFLKIFREFRIYQDVTLNERTKSETELGNSLGELKL
jgi:hypothetical protein